MGFNYGLEKKRFDAEWTRLRKEYAEAGMPEEDIQEMYDYDLKEFRRRRNNALHEQPYDGYTTPWGEEATEDVSPLLGKFMDDLSVTDQYTFQEERFAWIDTVKDEVIYKRLLLLADEEKELLTLIVVHERPIREIATNWSVSVQAIYKKIKKIKIFLSQV